MHRNNLVFFPLLGQWVKKCWIFKICGVLNVFYQVPNMFLIAHQFVHILCLRFYSYNLCKLYSEGSRGYNVFI
jgi:hypothetical protein